MDEAVEVPVADVRPRLLAAVVEVVVAAAGLVEAGAAAAVAEVPT